MEILLFTVLVSTTMAIARTSKAAQQRVTVDRERPLHDSTFYRTNVPDDRC